MSKKKKSKKPKTLTRQQRIEKGKHWILQYDGKKIVRGYRKKIGVDVICALKELKEIGCNFTPEYVEQLTKNEEQRIKQIKLAKEKKLLEKQLKEKDRYSDSDDTFYYIAGYTRGGLPYGITWEEMNLEPYEYE